MADPWNSRMWQGLMQWVEDEQHVERRRIVIEQARRQIVELLAEDHLDELTLDEFNEYVWRDGTIQTADGGKIDINGLQEYSVEEIKQRLASGDWTVRGNWMNWKVGQWTASYRASLKATDDMDDNELQELLRAALRDLLYSGDDPFEAAARVIKGRNGLGPSMVTLILSMMHPDRMGSMNEENSPAALRKLAWLLSTENEWEERISGDYREFNGLLQEIRDNSGGVLGDMLEVDAFLYRLTLLGEPQYWKVAISPFRADHDGLKRLFYEGGFAAISDDPEKKNNVEGWVERLRRINPGDYIVLHSHHKVVAVGRVTRPYYQVDTGGTEGLSAEYRHRVSVDWLIGTYEDDAGVFEGARQTNTVVILQPEHFWALAVKYADDPRYEEVLNPPTNWRELAGLEGGAWIFQWNPEKWPEGEAMLKRRTPFCEDWSVNQFRDRVKVGDTVYLWQAGDHRGIYAIATIISDVYEVPPDHPRYGLGRYRVNLKVHHILSKPLLREELEKDERLADLEILRIPRGTNFIVTPPERQAIEEMLRGRIPPTIEEVARACYCKVEFIEEIIRELERKGQAIFYGPPGTGKTYVARKLAEYLGGGDPDRWQLIQFHPSYTYEDFMEGIKPESRECSDGHWEVSYPVRPGSFMRFCQRAAKDPESTYVFVIDEINRGQIAKIFGELMYLLEYRDQEIELAYTKSEGDIDTPMRFGIPRNVYIIGTMNTADRSIALVDFALRRRFTFIPFYPDDSGPVQGMLARWLETNAPAMAWVAKLIVDLNDRLVQHIGRDFLIGHSYFMQKGLDDAMVEDIWHYQIKPLLQEYFVGNAGRADEFKLDELMARAKGLAEPVELGEDAEESVGEAEGDAE